MVSDPVWFPVATGRNATEMVQEAVGASVAVPVGQVLPVRTNPSLRLTAEIDTAREVLLFVTVTVFEEEVWPTLTLCHERVSGESDSWANGFA